MHGCPKAPSKTLVNILDLSTHVHGNHANLVILHMPISHFPYMPLSPSMLIPIIYHPFLTPTLRNYASIIIFIPTMLIHTHLSLSTSSYLRMPISSHHAHQTHTCGHLSMFINPILQVFLLLMTIRCGQLLVKPEEEHDGPVNEEKAQIG